MALKISEVNGMMVCQLIAGLSSEKDMKSMRLKSLFEKTDITVDAYKKFRDSLDISRRRTTLYKGGVTVTQNAIFFQLRGVDHDNSWLFFNCASDQGLEDNEFLGGIGLLTFINGQYEIQFLKLAIESADNRDLIPLSFESDALKEILCIDKLPNEHVHLSLQMNKTWNDLIVMNGRD